MFLPFSAGEDSQEEIDNSGLLMLIFFANQLTKFALDRKRSPSMPYGMIMRSQSLSSYSNK